MIPVPIQRHPFQLQSADHKYSFTDNFENFHKRLSGALILYETMTLTHTTPPSPEIRVQLLKDDVSVYHTSLLFSSHGMSEK
jgi:hypothetical protein